MPDRTVIIAPPSTLYPSGTGRWWHRETCPIQAGRTCTCDRPATK